VVCGMLYLYVAVVFLVVKPDNGSVGPASGKSAQRDIFKIFNQLFPTAHPLGSRVGTPGPEPPRHPQRQNLSCPMMLVDGMRWANVPRRASRAGGEQEEAAEDLYLPRARAAAGRSWQRVGGAGPRDSGLLLGY
jgi:hypothetical protein